MRRKIIAIGGGRMLVSAGKLPQTLAIDEEIVRLAAGKRPGVLFIPTASLDDPGYCDRFSRYFSRDLGCRVDSLLLYRDKPWLRDIRRQILAADIIYVGGGNTLRMMNLWRRLGIDKMINQARKNGAVLSGLSAGSICWFRQGNSDSRKFADESNQTLIKVSGLAYVDALVCPHYDVEKHREAALKNMMKNTRGIAIALENGSAIEVIDNDYRIITSMRNKNAWKVYWHRGRYHRLKLAKNGARTKLKDLLRKE